MTRIRAALAALILLAESFGVPLAHAAPPPNIVFILADDLGWVDTTPYGSTFHDTPNIARLAARGRLFTNAYAANPLCSPTRCSILTGLYPGRVGITTPSGHVPQVVLKAELQAKAPPTRKARIPASVTRLETKYTTLAESLKAAGYATGHFGKWHLGREPYSALQHGFDVDIPHFSGPGPAGGYLGPWQFWPGKGKAGDHIEDLISQEAAKFIRAHKDRPFYLNYWAFSVHGPWSAKPELIAHYKKKAATLPANATQRNPIYAAMVKSLDDAVGTLLDTLDELKIAERTVIVFFSDNGGIHWHDDRQKALGLDGPPTSNAPLKGGKATLWEGGTREPCLVVWPGKVKPGTKTDALLSSVDWYPTLLEITGVPRAPGQHFDGVSQVPALLGTGAPRDTAYCFFPHYTPATGGVPGVWVRKGNWKLLRFFCEGDNQADRFGLYDVSTDVGETRNLAAAHPDRVQELSALIDMHLKDMGAVVPVKNPAYRPGRDGM